MGLIRDLSNADRSKFDMHLSRYKEERKKAQLDTALRAQRATKKQAKPSAQETKYNEARRLAELREKSAERRAEFRALAERKREQYDQYSRPAAVNSQSSPVKNAASDVGSPTPARNAPPGLGQTDIVRGIPNYNPQKGDIGIQGSFDPARIDNIISGVRDSVKGLGSQGAAIDAANDERDIAGVLGILRDFGIGTGPDAMENLNAYREKYPLTDYNDQSLMDQRMANYAAMNAAASANSPSYEDLLSTFGFNPKDSKSIEDQYSDYLGGNFTGPVMGPSPNNSSSPSGNGSIEDQYSDYLGGNFTGPVMGPSPEQPVQPPSASSYPEGYGSALNAPPGMMFSQQFIDKDGDGVDDRFQAGPGQPKGQAGSNYTGTSSRPVPSNPVNSNNSNSLFQELLNNSSSPGNYESALNPNTSRSSGGYGSALNAPPGSMFTQQFIDKDGDGVDDRFQAGPGKPKQKAGSNFVGPLP